jgi:hypothetical protein
LRVSIARGAADGLHICYKQLNQLAERPKPGDAGRGWGLVAVDLTFYVDRPSLGVFLTDGRAEVLRCKRSY